MRGPSTTSCCYLSASSVCDLPALMDMLCCIWGGFLRSNLDPFCYSCLAFHCFCPHPLKSFCPFYLHCKNLGLPFSTVRLLGG